MATAYHGSSALFDRFDPSHLLEGDGKFKFGVGAYLTSRYTTAAHYSGATSSPDHYVYTVQIPDLTPDNHLRSLSPVHPDILRRVSERLGVEIPTEIRKNYMRSGDALKYYHLGQKRFSEETRAAGVTKVRTEGNYVWYKKDELDKLFKKISDNGSN